MSPRERSTVVINCWYRHNLSRCIYHQYPLRTDSRALFKFSGGRTASQHIKDVVEMTFRILSNFFFKCFPDYSACEHKSVECGSIFVQRESESWSRALSTLVLCAFNAGHMLNVLVHSNWFENDRKSRNCNSLMVWPLRTQSPLYSHVLVQWKENEKTRGDLNQ